MSENEKYASLVARQEELTALMSAGDLGPDDYTRLSREYAELSPVVEKIKELESARSELADLQELADDPEMRDMAETESRALRERLPDMEQDLRVLLLPKDAADEKNAILEVRAGTGGDEASLFAAELFRMYQRYADLQGWRFEVIDMDGRKIDKLLVSAE